MFIPRTLSLVELLKKKSFFLFGPRATGKSSLIRVQFAPDVLVVNLLRSEIYLQLSARPYDLESIIDSHFSRYAGKAIVVIDEVQRAPSLLNEVHRLIEERHIRFLLTGSSARSLKKSHVNLLAGRAWEAHLFPLTSHEIPNFDLERYLRYGGLPGVYLSEDPEEELIAYTDTYLREEIQAESLIRKIPAFAKFLENAAFCSGKVLNYSEIASDSGTPVSTVREYYQILADTFIGFILPAWARSTKRKAASTAKFYFFDTGVKHTIARLKYLEPKSDVYGQAFEHFIIFECRAYLSYKRLHLPMRYWRTKHGHEVDLLIGEQVAIEIKASEKITAKHLKGLQCLMEEGVFQRYILVSKDPIPRQYDCIELMPWQSFLSELWNHDRIIQQL